MAATVRPLVLWTGEVLRLLIGFGVLRQLAQTVSPEALGGYLTMVAIVMVLPRVLDAGVPQAMAYFLRAQANISRSALRLLVLHALAGIPLSFGLAWLLRYFPFEDFSVRELAIHHWATVAGLVVSETTALLALSTLIPRERYGSHVLATLTPPLLMLAAVSVCFVWGLHPAPAQLLSLLLAASMVGTALAWGTAVAGWPRHNVESGLQAGDLYRYGLRSYGTGLTKVATQRFDRLYLAVVLSAAGYSHYSLAVSMRDLAVFPANLHALTIRNRQIDMLARHQDLPGARRLLRRVCALWLLTGLATSALTWPAWPSIAEFLFGQPRPETAELAALLMLSVGPMAVLGFAWNHLYALERPGRVTLLNAVALALLVPIFVLAMSQVGAARGAAVAAVVWSTITAAASFGWALLSRPPEAR